MPMVALGAGDLTQGVVEGQAEDVDMEVNGVAGEVAFGPAPVTVFDNESGIGGQGKIARLPGDEFQSALLEPGAAARAKRCARRGFARATSAGL